MAATIEKELQIKSELIGGDAGVFEVTADHKTIYSKKMTGEFPDHVTVLERLREAQNA